MARDSREPLSPAEADTLRRIAGIIIPPDEENRVPGADDPLIIADICRSVGPDAAIIRGALTELVPLRQDSDIAAFVSGTPAGAALGRLILQCYYRDDRVLHAIGLEPRAPFPKGHTVEQGDWSLLDPVRTRRPFWRDDRSA